MKTRAYVSMAAGIFLIVVPAGIALLLATLVASHGHAAIDPAAMTGMYRGLGLISVAGAVAVVNATLLFRSGKANAALTVGMIGFFIAALFSIMNATSKLS